MKVKKAVFFSLFLPLFFILLFSLASCSDIFRLPENDKVPHIFAPPSPEMGAFSLRITGLNTKDGARTIVPTTIFAAYKLDFYYADDSETLAYSAIRSKDVSELVYLLPGTYNLHVTAYLDEDMEMDGAKAELKDEEAIEITSGEINFGEITLRALHNADEGEGVFSWKIQYDDAVIETASLKIESTATSYIKIITFTESDPEYSEEDSITLNAGYYYITLTLTSAEGKTITWLDTLHIYKNLTSHFEPPEFSGESFTKPQYMVVVKYNDEGATPDFVKTVFQGVLIEEPENPERAGFFFNGWYTDNGTFANAYNFDAEVYGNVRLFAKWEEYGTQTFNIAEGTWNWGDHNLHKTAWDGAVLNVNNGANIIVTGVVDGKRIVVNGAVRLTLKNLSITCNTDSYSPLSMSANTYLTLILSGENSLVSGGTYALYCINLSSCLFIDGDGSLNAVSNDGNAAAIGNETGGPSWPSGVATMPMIIQGGTIEARGSGTGAGINVGVNIAGGNIIAAGGDDGGKAISSYTYVSGTYYYYLNDLYNNDTEADAGGPQTFVNSSALVNSRYKYVRLSTTPLPTPPAYTSSPTATFNIADGTWTSGDNVSNKCDWNGAVLTVNNGANIIVTGSVNDGRRIVVPENTVARMTLQNLSITVTGDLSPIRISDPTPSTSSTSALILTLEGENILGAQGAVGLYSPSSNKLVVNGPGSLDVSAAAGNYAGIGVVNSFSGNMFFNNCTIIARGSGTGAGLGSSGGGGGNYPITINNSNVTAIGGTAGRAFLGTLTVTGTYYYWINMVNEANGASARGPVSYNNSTATGFTDTWVRYVRLSKVPLGTPPAASPSSPPPAATATFDIAAGTWSNGDDTSNSCAWNGEVLTVNNDANIIVTGTVNNNRRISVAANATAYLRLQDVSITTTNVSPLSLESSTRSSLTLLLEGENTLRTTAGGVPLRFLNNSSITIDGTGSLLAVAETGSTPGIGNNDNSSIGTIVINGGTVVAKGVGTGAGIGGTNQNPSGIIVINGGNVTATSGGGLAHALGRGGSSTNTPNPSTIIVNGTYYYWANTSNTEEGAAAGQQNFSLDTTTFAQDAGYGYVKFSKELLGSPPPPFAEGITATFDIETASWSTGTDASNRCEWDGTVLTVNNGANIAVTGTVTDGRKIVIASFSTANLTLRNSSITVDDGSGASSSPIYAVSANLFLTLEGSNVFRTGANSSYGIFAGGNLVIDGSGSLDVSSGRGIYAKNITINSGTITSVASFSNSTGIGSSSSSNSDFTSVTINGGNITARGRGDNSGIGGNPVIINGGNVTAISGGVAQAIGLGVNSSGTVTVNGDYYYQVNQIPEEYGAEAGGLQTFVNDTTTFNFSRRYQYVRLSQTPLPPPPQAPAPAVTFNIESATWSSGTAASNNCTWNGTTLTLNEGANIIVTGSVNNGRCIIVSSAGAVGDIKRITLNNASITGVDGANSPLTVNGHLVLTLEGDNTLISTGTNGAGLQVGVTAFCAITGSGSLNAAANLTSGNSAGIGGNNTSYGGSVIIKSGTITAKGFGIGSGIGRSIDSATNNTGGYILITGGNITAIAGDTATTGRAIAAYSGVTINGRFRYWQNTSNDAATASGPIGPRVFAYETSSFSSFNYVRLEE